MARSETKALRFKLEGKQVPIQLYREKRRNTRISKGASSFLLRIPRQLGSRQEEEALRWAFDWIRKQLDRNPDFLDVFQPRSFRNGDKIQTTAKSYTLYLQEEDRKSYSGKLIGREIRIKCPKGEINTESISNLIGRLAGADQMPMFARRVRELNALHFQEKLGTIRLKNSKARWGSCSGKGNLNFSTRLLKASEAARDYVIIHELAHLKEMNHSPRFWEWVERACPDYRVQEKWLKENREACAF
jgi:hypothetical protein